MKSKMSLWMKNKKSLWMKSKMGLWIKNKKILWMKNKNSLWTKNKKIILITAIILPVLITAIILLILLTGNNTDSDVTISAPTPAPPPTAQPAQTPPDEDPGDYEEPERELSAEELEFLNYDGPEMIMYHIWSDTFRELIETADRNLSPEPEQVVHYRPSGQEDMLLRFMIIAEGEGGFFRDESMSYGVPGLTIDTTLFETFSSAAGVENILDDNGVSEPVTDYFIFVHELYFEQRIPPTVVAYTENNVYFIVIEMTDGKTLDQVYTHSEYREKYRVYDGELIVNEIPVPVPTDILTFEYKQMFAPLRLILEAINCDVRVESEIIDFGDIFTYGLEELNITMFFSRNGKNYALEIERWAPTFRDLKTGYWLFDVIPEDHMHFVHGRYKTTEDFEFYVDETVLRNVLELVDATLEIDYDKRRVEVTS